METIDLIYDVVQRSQTKIDNLETGQQALTEKVIRIEERLDPRYKLWLILGSGLAALIALAWRFV